ncbi:hypothetical protein [Streptomyces sp. NBC_01264]|uniref:hypothetical protein n=1 Tax=Streptomyces sp. NBC_01264 TaxID=2903804 RepID=UPI00224CBA85|nr:hypothetical protein [Streptomyces sp. NBC_01264]MCX4781873.1 hypothetical protein [Streptomyces sp. NBC_01264]
MTTENRWHLRGSAGYAYSGDEARNLLRHRWDWGNPETWFESDAGQLLGVITDGERATVTLVAAEGGPGEHLVDPRGDGSADGFAFDLAAQAVAHFIERGSWPPTVVGVAGDHGEH